MTRLERYRALLARIEPTDPKDFAGNADIYVPPPNGVSKQLATALALQPASSHLVVGAIGSGKTTTLRRAVDGLKDQVKEAGDHVVYVDVSAEHRLDEEPLGGVLLALAGIALRGAVKRKPGPLSASLTAAYATIERHAHDYIEWVDRLDLGPDWDDEEEDERDYDVEVDDSVPVRHPGALKPPPSKSTRFAELAGALRTLREALGAHVTLFFDSLDRLENSARFAEAVTHDLPALASAGIGVAVVGPYRFALSKDRAIADLFDEIHVVQTANGLTPEGRGFLSSVLRGRAPVEMFPDDAVDLAAWGSGGVLRDLLSIATRAARHAYDLGHPHVTAEDVGVALRAVGGAKAVGLDDASLSLLARVSEGHPFNLDDKRLPLVERGQVVQTGVGEWTVHPALQAFMKSRSRAA